MPLLPLLSALALLVLVGTGGASAHEPFMQLTVSPDGLLLVETGFSDDGSVAGLPLVLRERATNNTLAAHILPEDGRLAVPIPAVPYRVTFDAGPGHKLSQIGPEARAPVPPPAPGPASLPAVGPPASPGFVRELLPVGLVFLLAAVSFALGYAAGRSRNT